jgi:hypothetical protein
MKASTRLSRAFGVLVLSGLVSCAPAKLPPATVTVTNEEADLQLEQELKLSEDLRAQLDKIRKALRPIQGALRDLDKALSKQVSDERVEGALTGILERLEDALLRVRSGKVKKREDGSWIHERPSPLAMLPGTQGTCAGSRVRVVGEKASDIERITLSMSDCSRPDQFVDLASVEVRANGEREIEIAASAFQGVWRETVQMDRCRLHIDTSDYASLTCDPFETQLGELTATFSKLGLAVDQHGLYASTRVVLANARGDFERVVVASLAPQQEPVIRVCTRKDDASCSVD